MKLKREDAVRKFVFSRTLQLWHSDGLTFEFLFNIAKADGNVSKSEIEKLLEFTRYLNISRIDFESIKAMFFKSSDSDYKILEIDKNCTNDELKKAYRELAKKHHPDKVQNLGEVSNSVSFINYKFICIYDFDEEKYCAYKNYKR